jgi:acetyl esterase
MAAAGCSAIAIHDFMLLNSIANTPATRGAVDQASSYLRKVFAEG